MRHSSLDIRYLSIKQLLQSNEQNLKMSDGFDPHEIIEEDDWDDKIYLAEYAVDTPRKLLFLILNPINIMKA